MYGTTTNNLQKMYKTVGSSTQHKVRMFIQTILFVLTKTYTNNEIICLSEHLYHDFACITCGYLIGKTVE